MIAVRAKTRRLRVTYHLAPPLAGGATMLFGFEVLDLGYPWSVVLACGAIGVVATVLSIWITGRPHFFSSPFK